jgi:hypothetical protein
VRAHLQHENRQGQRARDQEVAPQRRRLGDLARLGFALGGAGGL